ncbi:hypothetical protein ABUL04_04890 [Micromonospora harpali]|uniref:Ribbon-helix-helix protein, copG family n=1 Tax=Micromonospora harpali TaxID=1490225 RepID=A0ABW1HR41_9ACTN
MTKKITISLPDELAARLAEESNVSAYVAEALRRRIAGERTREILRKSGFAVTEAGVARAHAEIEQLKAGITPELREQSAQLKTDILAARAKARR